MERGLTELPPVPSIRFHRLLRHLIRPPAASRVQQIESTEAFQQALAAAADKLVVDFSATYCGPCKTIKPFFHSLCDDCQDAAADCEVKCTPSFPLFKKGEKVSEFSGANKEKLEGTINELVCFLKNVTISYLKLISFALQKKNRDVGAGQGTCGLPPAEGALAAAFAPAGFPVPRTLPSAPPPRVT
ncbi:thioredoxin-2, mitochondrial-like [Octodon degus]|uniref:Thioredoxin-2, mitochondrial-like n=1 Tax=Octodon degus TaxID=10160 RepID=A0A6P6DZ39_OCTDE|nr:thioredoxin-2, mitochondrial-like [Octodon degus]